MTDCLCCTRYFDPDEPGSTPFACSDCEEKDMGWIWPLIIIGPLMVLGAWLISFMRETAAVGRRRSEAKATRRAMKEAGL